MEGIIISSLNFLFSDSFFKLLLYALHGYASVM